MPHAVGPEKSVLSNIMRDPVEYFGRALEQGIIAQWFYSPANSELFEVLLDLFTSNKEIELVSLVQTLLNRGKLEICGGPGYIAEIHNYAILSNGFDAHLHQVKDFYAQRELLRLCSRTSQEIYDSPEETVRILDDAESAIMAIRASGEHSKEETTVEASKWVLDELSDRIRGISGPAGLPTGFVDLDELTGGLKPSDMMVVAARPGMGKTSWLLDVADHLAVESSKPGLIFSLEMNRRQLLKRMIYKRARLSASQVDKGYKPNKGELQRVRNATMLINQSGIVIDEREGLTITQIRSKARRVKRALQAKGLDLYWIGLDYLQLAKSTSKQALGNREREISEISSGLKGMAKELNIPVIVLAQLNRGPENRPASKSGDKKKEDRGAPRMSDLRESGSIEQDADYVGLLYRSQYYAEGDDKDAVGGQSYFDLPKNRHGETGRVKLTFIGELSKFESSSSKAWVDLETEKSFTDVEFDRE